MFKRYAKLEGRGKCQDILTHKVQIKDLKNFVMSFTLGRFLNCINGVFVNGNWGKMQKETAFVFGWTVRNFQKLL